MKRVGLTAAIILLTLLTVFVMQSQRMNETVQLWKKYNIIYISTDYSEQEIFDLCSNNGIDEIIARQNSLFSVKNRMVPTLSAYGYDGFTSETMRNFFFSDKSQKYFLFYIPEENLASAGSCLEKEHIPFGIDAAAEYPALCPIVCFAAFILLILLNRVDFTKALCLLPLISVSYAVPFYSVAAAVCCMVFIYMICDLYERRSGALRMILKNTALFVILFDCLASLCMSGLKAILLFIFALIISGAFLFIRKSFKAISYNESHFKSVPIINARWIKKDSRYNMASLTAMLSICVCFLVLSLFSGITGTGSNSQDLLLPSPSVYTEDEGFTASAYDELKSLHATDRNPDLSDFLNEKWYAQTAAYRKVTASFETAKAGDTITFPYFFDDGNGIMKENDQILFSFDDEWISSTATEFGKKEGIERLLVSQEGFYTTDYASSGKLEVSSLILPAVALCVLCFLVLAVIYCSKRLKK